MKRINVDRRRTAYWAAVAALAVGLALLGGPVQVAWAGTFGPVNVTDQTPLTPLANPAPASYEPRYVSGFGQDNSFTLFFEDRAAGSNIRYVQTTTGPTGFPAAATATNINDTHFRVKPWPYTDINGRDWAYRAWASVGNNPQHNFYVSNDLTTWILAEANWTISNGALGDGYGWVYYGFHDVIQLNGTYYAFAETNQSQTLLVRSANGDHVWEAIAVMGGTPASGGPLQLPAGVGAGWTPAGNFIDLGHDRGMGKLYNDPRDSYWYLAVNTAAQASLAPAALEAAFINPANWSWHDGTTGPAAAPILAATIEHTLDEMWVVPQSDPDAPWPVVYNGDYGGTDGDDALGWTLIGPPLPPPPEVWVDDDYDAASCTADGHTWQVDCFDVIGDGVNAVADGGTVHVAAGLYDTTVETFPIDVNRPMTILGPQAGVDPRPFAGSARTAGSVGEAIVDGGGTAANLLNITASDVVIDGLEFTGATGDMVQSLETGDWSNVILRNNLVHDGGDEGIQLRACTNCTIETNYLFDIAQDGINFCCDSTGGLIRSNEIAGSASENGVIYIYYVGSIDVVGNYLHDNTAADGIKFYDTDGGSTYTIVNNLIAHNDWSDAKRVIDNNAIHIYKSREGDQYFIYHNTLDDNQAVSNPGQGNGILACDYYNAAFVTTVSGNLITNQPGYGLKVDCSNYDIPYLAPMTYDHNDLWQNTLGATDGNPTDNGGNLAVDPGYVAPAAYDYHLAAGSPAIDTAADVGVADDIEAAARPADGDGNGSVLPDMGAFEVQPSLGTIVIRKETDPDGATDLFGFTATYTDPFSLADGGSHTAAGVPAGAHTVTETVPAGWELTAIACVDPSQDTTADAIEGVATIELDAGETVTCTFTNTERGKIIVEKQTLPDGAAATFHFSGTLTADLADGHSESRSVRPGTYQVSEVVPGGWDLTGIACSDGDSGGDLATATATFRVKAGETVTCTFTNTQRGRIIVEKQTLPDGAAATFHFSGMLTADLADGQSESRSVRPGTYQVSEVVPEGWDLTGIACSDGNSGGDLATATATFRVKAGETVRCVFTNTQQGRIIVEKQTDPDGDPTEFSFSGRVNGLLRDGERLSRRVPPGTYHVTEAVPEGWDLESIDCSDGNSSGNLSTATAAFRVGAGETVRCVFTNKKEPVPPPQIQVAYLLDPSQIVEPGGLILFVVTVKNLGQSPVSLFSLVDSVFGSLDGRGTCALPHTIPAGGSYECEFEAPVSGSGGDLRTFEVTAKAQDSHGQQAQDSAAAALTIVDLPSRLTVTKLAVPATIPEPGAMVTFTVLVENSSAVDQVTIQSVTDNLFGDVSAGCLPALPAALAPGASLTCTFSRYLSGQPGDQVTDTATVSGVDDDGAAVGGTAQATVTVGDVPSSLAVTKTANPPAIAQPGGEVLFTVVVENTSPADQVTIQSVVDDVYGDVGAGCVPALPATLAPGESLVCTFSGQVSGTAGTAHSNSIAVLGVDDDGTPVSGAGGVVVPILPPPAFHYYLPIMPKHTLP